MVRVSLVKSRYLVAWFERVNKRVRVTDMHGKGPRYMEFYKLGFTSSSSVPIP